MIFAITKASVRRLSKPLGSGCITLWNTLSKKRHTAQIVGSFGVPLFGGLQKPLRCLVETALRSGPIKIASTKIVLGPSVTLSRRFPKPLKRFNVILLNTHATRVVAAQFVLRHCVAGFRSLRNPFEGLYVVFRY